MQWSFAACQPQSGNGRGRRTKAFLFARLLIGHEASVEEQRWAWRLDKVEQGGANQMNIQWKCRTLGSEIIQTKKRIREETYNGGGWQSCVMGVVAVVIVLYRCVVDGSDYLQHKTPSLALGTKVLSNWSRVAMATIVRVKQSNPIHVFVCGSSQCVGVRSAEQRWRSSNELKENYKDKQDIEPERTVEGMFSLWKYRQAKI